MPSRLKRFERCSNKVDCLDISPNGQLFVIGGRELQVGKLQVGQSSIKPLALVGHVGDILDCRFVRSYLRTLDLCEES